MKRIIIATTLFTLTACASTNDVQQGWVGHSESELFAAWGAPLRTAQMPSGEHVGTWEVRNHAGQVNCSANFVISKNGIIESYSNNCSR